MMDDIVEEVRRAREDYARQFNYELRAVFADIKRQQEGSGREVVLFLAKPVPSRAKASSEG